MTPPSVSELMLSYLNQSDSSGIHGEEMTGEVQPYEVDAGFRADPRQSWLAAVAPAGTVKVTAPSEWATTIFRHAPTAAVPMVCGNYPQRVRELSRFLHETDFTKLRPLVSKTNVPASSALRTWADRQSQESPEAAVVAVGVLRAFGDLELAEKLLNSISAEHLKSQIENERAALAWQRGDWATAETIWKNQPETAVSHFNRGMSALFGNRFSEARRQLELAVEHLSEESPWLHLARLYLTLAEMRG